MHTELDWRRAGKLIREYLVASSNGARNQIANNLISETLPYIREIVHDLLCERAGFYVRGGITASLDGLVDETFEEDMVHEAATYVWENLNKYDPAKGKRGHSEGERLRAFVNVYGIRGAFRAAPNMMGALRLPEHLMYGKFGAYATLFDPEASLADNYAAIFRQVSKKEWKGSSEAPHRIASAILQGFSSETESMDVLESCASADTDTYDILLAHDLLNAPVLTGRERLVLKKRYWDKMTLEEVGREYNVTRERIRQIQEKAHEKIRKYIGVD